MDDSAATAERECTAATHSRALRCDVADYKSDEVDLESVQMIAEDSEVASAIPWSGEVDTLTNRR